MNLLRGLDDVDAVRGGFLSIGNFDGVHLGHQRILSELVAQARAASVPAVVMTFDPHPIEILAPGRTPPNLTTLRRKSELIACCGVDALLVMPTDRNLLGLAPQEFFEGIVCEELAARGMVEGPNFYFGKDRAGSVDTLRELCGSRGMSMYVVEPVFCGETKISSSEIRRVIQSGKIVRAVQMLGHPYQIEGRVTRGAGRGREIGFPTANLEQVRTLLPPDGVYAATVSLDGQHCEAAVHLGPNPTFGDSARKLEVHLIDASVDLYSRELRVDLHDHIRETQTFNTADELMDQLRKDIAEVSRRVAAGEGDAS